MTWPQLQLDNWDHFLRISSHIDFGPVATFPYLFRGQANATWTLKPSLGRQLPANCSESAAARIEEDCCIQFAEQAHLHISPVLLPNANDKLTWWGLMQHHHAPTRLLDWTSSPFVAAYFTVVDSWDSDGAIWLFHAKTLLDESRNKPADPASAVQLFLPPHPPHRLIAQQGRFIYHNRLVIDFEVVLDTLLTRTHQSCGQEVLRKIVVPKEIKPQMLRHLRSMNITAASLFPSIDGLGYSASELVRLSAVYPWTDDV